MIAGMARALGSTKMEVLERSGMQRWRLPPNLDPEWLAMLVIPAGLDTVIEYAEPNYIWHAQAGPSDPRKGELWSMHSIGQAGGTVDADIDALEAWAVQTGSSAVVVGVIDSGIDYSHPDLAANIWVNPGEIACDGIDNDGNCYVHDVHGWDFVNDDNDPMDDFGHGTHVAGTIGAVGDNGVGVVGVCWTVRLMPLKFLDSTAPPGTSRSSPTAAPGSRSRTTAAATRPSATAGASCTSRIVLVARGAGGCAYSALAFDASGNPAIAYSDDLAGDGWLDTLKFARWNGSSWDGQDWQQRSTAARPVARTRHRAIFDDSRSQVVLFGGADARGNDLGDTWEYAPQTPASYTTFGGGCVGSNGRTPSLTADPFRLPWIGDTFLITVADLPASGTPTFICTGFSKFITPLDLGSIGFTGCTLFFGPQVVYPITNVNGTAHWTLPIPNAPALAGRLFYNQALTMDSGTPGGARLSNAVEGQVGARSS